MNSTATRPDWASLLTAVENNQGVHRVTMETLRQLEGRQRVGKHILRGIEEKLRTLGLGHLPRELPNRQQQSVLLYRIGTPASEVIEAVETGLAGGSATESAFHALHRLNSLPDPETVVSRQEIGEAAKDATRAVLDLLLRVNGDESSAAYSNGSSDRLDLTELVRELSPTGEGFRR